MVPVARNVWQHVKGRSPAAADRRLHALEERRAFGSSSSAASTYLFQSPPLPGGGSGRHASSRPSRGAAAPPAPLLGTGWSRRAAASEARTRQALGPGLGRRARRRRATGPLPRLATGCRWGSASVRTSRCGFPNGVFRALAGVRLAARRPPCSTPWPPSALTTASRADIVGRIRPHGAAARAESARRQSVIRPV